MNLLLQPWQTATLTLSFWLVNAGSALAQVYGGGGVKAGVSAASQTGVSNVSLKSLIGNIVDEALLFVSLLAVAVIIIAGFYLILGMGSDSSRETAKKIIIYVSVGLIVIILSKLFVNLIKSLV